MAKSTNEMNPLLEFFIKNMLKYDPSNLSDQPKMGERGILRGEVPIGPMKQLTAQLPKLLEGTKYADEIIPSSKAAGKLLDSLDIEGKNPWTGNILEQINHLKDYKTRSSEALKSFSRAKFLDVLLKNMKTVNPK